jgi:transposase
MEGSGGTMSGVARDLEVHATEALRSWVRHSKIDDGSREGLTSEEREKLARAEAPRACSRPRKRSW